MTEEMDGQMNLFDPDSWSGKTSPELSAATKARTSEPSSKRRQGLRTVVPLFLDLRKENGLLRESSWEMGGPLLGEYSMHSFGESPRDGVESHLSQILEACPHPKYYLSERACQGILRRAEKRGKELPPILKQALLRQSASRNEQAVTGGVKESLSSTTGQEHSQPSTINECYVDGSGKSQTMVSKGPNAVCIGNGQTDQLKVSEKVGALNCMHDQQAIMAYSLQGSMIGRAEKNGPQGDGVNKDRSFTLNSTDRHAVTDAAIVRRLTPLECERLQGYPTGWTDIGNWTDSRGKTRKCTDSARYKALGNSIALPPWTYVITRLNAYCKEHTMASLFDGIGGFPLIWTRLGGACLWASEIEEFPIVVTKIRFGQE